LAGELDDIERTDCDANLDAQAEQILESLWTMHAGLEYGGDPSRRRELLRRVIDRIDLHFDSVQKGKRSSHPCSKGDIHLRHDPRFFGHVSRGEWTRFELFLAGVQGLPATIRAMLCQAATG